MCKKGSFDFGCRQSVAGDIDDIIDTSSDPVVTIVVTAGTVTGELIQKLLDLLTSEIRFCGLKHT